MLDYTLRRIAFLALVLFVVTTITFSLAYLVPGDPARLVAGDKASQEQVEVVRIRLGLDRPIPVQYAMYLGRLLRGDLGRSLHSNRPVLEDIRDFFSATFELTTLAMGLTVVIGIPLGVLSAVRRGSLVDHASRLFSLAGVSLPVFWLGLLLQLAFGMALGLPIAGRVSSRVLMDAPLQTVTGMYLIDSLLTRNWAVFRSAATHIVLPMVTLALPSLVLVTRMVRSSLLEVLVQDYIRTARAYGFPERVIMFKYALKNAMLATLTLIGLAYGYLLGGSFLVEAVFAWPGLGRYAASSIILSDYPAIMGVTLLVTLAYGLVNLAVDLCYAWIDPRVKLR